MENLWHKNKIKEFKKKGWKTYGWAEEIRKILYPKDLDPAIPFHIIPDAYKITDSKIEFIEVVNKSTLKEWKIHTYISLWDLLLDYGIEVELKVVTRYGINKLDMQKLFYTLLCKVKEEYYEQSIN